MTKTLVTGAAGFIGFHTSVRLLQDGHDVVGIDNLNDYYDPALKEARLRELSNFQRFRFIKQDIADRTGMEALWRNEGPFTKVVHLAAQAGVRYSLENPYQYIASNCLGHVTVLEMCRHTKDFEHLVYASSSSVYGGNDKMPFSVQDRVDTPVSLYAATKRSDELMSHTYAHLFGLKQTALRFFTVYGPWGRPDMSPYLFTRAVCDGAPLKVFNHGDMKRDFTYVDDIVEGVVAALNTPPAADNDNAPHRILNLGNNRSENLMDFIRTIEKAVGKKANLHMMDMQPGDVKETYADISETTELLGYVPKTSIDEGIPKYVEWFKGYYDCA